MNRNYRLWVSFLSCVNGGLAASNMALDRFFIGGVLASLALILAMIAVRGEA